MQIGVYGSGYLGTVISACLADFGTPVSCCHPDRTRMVEMAQGNIPFLEKNLKEIIRRNVRAGRLAYSTDIESFARKTQVIFLAEDNADNLTDVVMRIARLAHKASDSDHRDSSGSGNSRSAREITEGCGPAWDDRLSAHVLYRRLRGGRLQLARPADSGLDLERSGAGSQADFSSAGDARACR